MLGLQRYAIVLATQYFRKATYSGNVLRSSTNVATIVATNQTVQTNKSNEVTNKIETKGEEPVKKAKGKLVAAAFENLKDDSNQNESATPAIKLSSTSPSLAQIDEQIINAKTVNSLLALAENNSSLTRKHALRIVSILSDWTSMNRAKLSEFENDHRFLRICRMLGRSVPKDNKQTNSNENKAKMNGFRTDDLNTVLGVAGDDEAAKLIASISVPQMVRVMSTLAIRRRRSTPLLRSLAFNISSANDQLDLKQCADVFYAMASLNFQDVVLAAKLCADIQVMLPKNNDKSAAVGSILTSLGILKYRDLDVLESLTKWILQHSDICRPQDVSALFLTSATLNFKTTQIDEVRSKLLNAIVQQDLSKSHEWLNHVWALVLSGLCDHKHLQSVLCTGFIDKLQSEQSNGLTATTKMKLLNVNSYAQLMAPNYQGPLLVKDSPVFDVPMIHGKSKQILVNGMLDALKSLLSSNNYVKSLQDSKMGFLIDALCVFDAKRNPLPVDKDHPESTRVALMVVDYHDVCHGTHRAASGITTLCFDLLEKQGYCVLPVPYNEFSTSDKLLKRVQYLEGKFKSIISSKTNK
uniref:RAP domain-containing protein n=1 Tax=Glossina brevipalpis TaxID=37001 RepID=A0A1A9WNM3_9MUSC